MRSIYIGIFLSLVLIFISSAHYLVFRSFGVFFPGLLDSVSKKWLFSVILLMSTGFIFSSVSVHWYENMFTRAFYLLSGSWLGIFSNIFWSTILLLILYNILNLLKVNLTSFSYVVAGVYSIMFFISIQGLWIVEHPVIKNIDVFISNLPKDWEGKKIAQLSDVHLGIVHREDYLQKIVDKVNKQNVDMVVITGDFFDGMDGRLEHLAYPLNRLKTTLGIFYVTGNHETYLGTNKTNLILEKESGVRHLKNEAITINGLNLIGIDYPEQGQKINLVEEVKKLTTKDPAILLFHEPKNVEELAKLGKIDLMLSGHTHYGQIWPYNFIAKFVYGKYVYGLSLVNNMTQYTSSGVGTWGPPMRLGTKSEIPIFTLYRK
ncbi:MAG: metallophosphoesterase [bacterium]